MGYFRISQSCSRLSHPTRGRPNSFPMKFSFLPGCAIIYRYIALACGNLSSYSPFIFWESLPFHVPLRHDSIPAKMLIIIIHHRECQLMIISASVFWCTLEIFQCIVHETKIPLVIKTKSSLVNRFGNTWKIGGISLRSAWLSDEGTLVLVHHLQKIQVSFR